MGSLQVSNGQWCALIHFVQQSVREVTAEQKAIHEMSRNLTKIFRVSIVLIRGSLVSIKLTLNRIDVIIDYIWSHFD